MARTTNYTPTKDTEQNLQNLSFDQELKINAVEVLSVNPITGQLERPMAIQGNGSTVLIYTGSNLTTIEKTIGTVTYTKTLSYDGSNNLTGVSVWS